MKGSVVAVSDKSGRRKYQALYPYKNQVSGRWTNRSVGTFRTEREAWAVLREKIRQFERGGIQPNRMTLGDIFNRWLNDAKARGIAYNTQVSYEQSVRLYLLPLLGSRLAQTFTVQAASDVRDYFVQHCTSARANRNMRHLSQALQYAVRAELLDRNVAGLVGLPKHEHANKGWYTLDQWRKLEEVARGYTSPSYDGTNVPWGPRLMASLLTGLRQGQLSGLRWSDYDRYGKFVVNDIAIYVKGKGRVLKPTRNDKSEPHLVDVPPALLPSLDIQRTWWRQRKLEAQVAPDFEDNDLIFPDAWGRPPSTALYHRHFVRMMDLAGVPRIRPHDLRRSFASVLKFELQEDTRTVMQLLGHKSEATTERYLGISTGASSAAVKRLSDRLSPAEYSPDQVEGR
jgi:integrase